MSKIICVDSYLMVRKIFRSDIYRSNPTIKLGPSINGLVTGGNTKLCCRGFILVLVSTTANKIDSERIRDYNRLLPVCEAEILQAT